MKRKFFAYVLSILETKGPEALKDFELSQILEWSELNRQDKFYSFTYNITAEGVQIIEKNTGSVIGKLQN